MKECCQRSCHHEGSSRYEVPLLRIVPLPTIMEEEPHHHEELLLKILTSPSNMLPFSPNQAKPLAEPVNLLPNKNRCYELLVKVHYLIFQFSMIWELLARTDCNQLLLTPNILRHVGTNVWKKKFNDKSKMIDKLYFHIPKWHFDTFKDLSESGILFWGLKWHFTQCVCVWNKRKLHSFSLRDVNIALLSSFMLKYII